MTLLEGQKWAETFEENPRLVVVWGLLKSIAEPSGFVVDTAVGFGAMAEKHGKKQFDALKTAHVP